MVDIMMLQRNTSISVIWQLMATKAIMLNGTAPSSSAHSSRFLSGAFVLF